MKKRIQKKNLNQKKNELLDNKKMVYINKNGKFHTNKNCAYLNEENSTSLIIDKTFISKYLCKKC